jgi:hypothetical protein
MVSGHTRIEQVYDAANRRGLAALAAIFVSAESVSVDIWLV